MPIIKIKVDRDRHIDLVRIAREEHPGARIIIDANQAWDRSLLERLTPRLKRLGVELIEQPWSLARLKGLYHYVNIKLDKSGGLTEGLALARSAMAAGFGLMVGNMGGTSLSMAPHFLIAQHCRYVDLDGPLIISSDRAAPMIYEGACLHPPERALWG